MRHSAVLAIVVATAMIVPLSVATRATADSDAISLDVIESIKTIDSSVLEDVAPLDSSLDEDTLVLNGSEANVTVPRVVADGILMSSGDDTIGIMLPTTDNASNAEVHPEGAVSYEHEDGTTTVAAVRQSGSVQITTVISDASAPEEFRYALDLPDQTRMVSQEDGSISVLDEDGALTAIIDAPWAKDATGASVPTRYVISGSTLTQIVDHEGAVYPVIADPWWIPALSLMARISAHAASQIAARNIAQNLVRIALQEGKRTRGNEKGTSVFSANNIRVIVNDKTGNIISVTRAGGGGTAGGR